MAILTVNDVTVSFGEETILEGITLEMQKGEHIGLVGVNGSGKTTLFKTLTGEYTPDTGSVIFAKDCTPGYMEQHVCRDFEKTAFEEVMTVFAPLLEMEKELESLSSKLSQNPPEQEMEALILRQTELNDRFVDGGGLTCRSRARSALLGLGFTEEQIQNRVGVLSGGQKAKLQLAKMLLGGANLLLLDEPTNHLDIQSVEWLEDFLKNYPHAYVVISHDRYFLDKVTSRTLELQGKHLESYKGNYTRYLALKEEKRLAMQRVYESTQREIKRIEGIIEQQRRWNQERNYVTIASKQKSINRLEATLEKPEDDPVSIRFQFHASRRSGDDVLTAQGLSLAFGETPLFENVDIEIKRGEKIFLIGPNGCGKTSLFKILLGQYRQDEGEVRLGVGVDLGYYEQFQLSLHDNKAVIDEIWDIHPQMTQTEIRSALAIFLFKGEDVFKPIGALSGGERARVLLLKLMLSRANFLLLDEPTNHLDIGSCEALEEALSGYDGTLFVVSHDRYLINRLADKVYALTPQGAELYLGNYDAYLEKREARQAIAEKKAAPKQNLYKQRKERDAELRKKRAALRRLETEIEENDGAVSELEKSLENPDIAADYEAVARISQEIAELREKADALLMQWTALSEELEGQG
ncbi:ATP-binding cassette domain-containing protein [Neglecta sp. X4]|uniref:ABC transporter ATP-binding protein n=1 Tax=unclassified Neglectibacter TaxID=2632164 RepID=UPI00136BF59D|nr:MULTISPECIES: ATP-binding cassette domain-containing protein [unclassified Neglectibacter]NBI17880.1 ATP-binding cassette domain-containing protein [Neglectibacter sp. 59]NBJ73307.1 ATP-binding cassette domain-containing protein [Neglectibacter sp. X4]NCE81155.1 ATP-binding cassette domain-containing protein [Neglectibacter sp. X58]